MGTVVMMLAAIGLGMVLTLQVGSNSTLGRAVGNFYLSAAVNMSVGVLASCTVLLIATRAWPSPERLGSAPWWSWPLGGILGTLYINGYLALAPRMGAGSLVGCIITGQLAFAVLADHFGWLGFRQHSVTLGRMAGCGLMIGGVWLVTRR